VCPGCGSLVGVNDETCYNCGRWNPSLWGLSPLVRRLGQDLGFVQFIMVGTIGHDLATLAGSGSDIGGTAWQYALLLFVFGLFMNAVDNWAHAGGFVGGYIAALLLDPSKRERVDHLIGAFSCLVITIAAVATSLLTSFGVL
jgi:membrane associated rhomboid family serine protease